jgi:hypothetical protein
MLLICDFCFVLSVMLCFCLCSVCFVSLGVCSMAGQTTCSHDCCCVCAFVLRCLLLLFHVCMFILLSAGVNITFLLVDAYFSGIRFNALQGRGACMLTSLTSYHWTNISLTPYLWADISLTSYRWTNKSLTSYQWTICVMSCTYELDLLFSCCRCWVSS